MIERECRRMDYVVMLGNSRGCDAKGIMFNPISARRETTKNNKGDDLLTCVQVWANT